MTKFLVSGLVGAFGVVALAATSVSAAVVCNDEGDCWRTKERYAYPPEVSLNIYDDRLDVGRQVR